MAKIVFENSLFSPNVSQYFVQYIIKTISLCTCSRLYDYFCGWEHLNKLINWCCSSSGQKSPPNLGLITPAWLNSLLEFNKLISKPCFWAFKALEIMAPSCESLTTGREKDPVIFITKSSFSNLVVGWWSRSC